MAELTNFGEDVEPTDLSGFSAPSEDKPVKSDSSDKVVAAQGALLSDNPDEIYNAYVSLYESPDEDKQARMSEITDRIHQKSVQFSQDVASQMLLDPDISTEEANSIVLAMSGMQADKPSSTDMLAEKMGSLPSGGDEDLVSEDIRLDAAELSKHVNQRMQQKQALLNGHLLSTNKGALHTTADLFEQLAPLTDGLITAQLVNEIRGGSVSSTAHAMLLLGSAKTEIKDYYMGLGSLEQMAFEKALAEALNNTTGITFTNDNDLAQKDIFNSIVEGNYYGDFDKYLDNIVGVLDLIGIGSLLRPVKMARMSIKASNLARRFMRSEVQPSAPIKTVGETNPEEARKLQTVAELDETGEAAQALHGASKEEAIVDAEAPQPRTEDGSVENKVNDLARDIKEFIHSGNIDVSESELLSAQRASQWRLLRLNGITNRTTMAQYKSPEFNKDGTTVFQNVYGPADSSYKTPQEGIDNVLHALRDYNVDESDLTILRRVDDEYVPTTLKEIEAKQALRDEIVKKKKKLPEELRKENMRDDYLIQVNFEHDFDPMDLQWDKLTVKRNFFDRIPFFNKAKKGSASLMRSLVDIHSMLDPRITLGANVAVDKSSAIETAVLKHADAFVKPFNNLDKERQLALMEVIQNNNFTGKLTPKKTLKAQGYSKEEMDLLDKWKDSWDQLYHLENLDLIKTLKANGYQRFVDSANDTELVARKMGRNYLGKVRNVYDSALGKTRVLTDKELDDLYANGGTIAQLRSPAKSKNGKDFEHVLVRNQENKSMLRDFRESDRVLNYRAGYYTVRYKDPHIIVKVTKDANGVEHTQAVKTAGSKKEAELAVANFGRGNTDPNVSYRYRDNRDRTVGQMEDDAWSIHSASGRTSQRLRGERLGSTEPDLQGSAMGAVEGPAEALLNSVRSISRRTSMRDYIERYKMRFMDNYSELIKIDENSGQPKFPRSAEDFKVVEGSSSQRLADARTNLEYINYLENGYRNGLDDSWKALLNGVADVLGDKYAGAAQAKLAKLPKDKKDTILSSLESEEFAGKFTEEMAQALKEKGLSNTEVKLFASLKSSSLGEKIVRGVVEEIPSPTTWFKARAFDAYLALNPLRQFVVQGHQASLLAANFTKYVASQKLAQDVMAIHAVMLLGDKVGEVKGLEKLVGMKASEAKALAEEYRKTGFDASIDRNNLVENGLDHLVDTEHLARTKQLYKTVVGASRKVGFDAGERINIMSSWLAHRNKALEDGKDITSKRVKDEIMAKARNYTFNMNAAGDMPYNKNSLALLFQFMQVPHKAMLQMTNRALSPKERIKLGAYNAVMLPLPVGIGHSLISTFEIEDENARDFIANGLEGLLLNKMAQLMFDDDTRVDFSSLAAVDPNAPYELIHGLLTSDISEILANAPALSLWGGYNPRMTNIIKETYNFVTEPQDISLEESLALMNTFATFSSGYANMSKSFRELFVQEYDRRYSTSGAISDGNITTPEKIAKILGFGSLEEAYIRETKSQLYKASQEAREDVKTWYTTQKQLAAKKGINMDNPEWQSHMMRAFWTVGEFSLGQQQEVLSLMTRDAKKGDNGLYGLIFNNMNYIPVEEIEAQAYGAGIHDEISETIQAIITAEKLGENNVR